MGCRHSLFVGFALLAAVPAWAQNPSTASEQAFPAKPVRIVTGGSGTFHDIVTRHLGQRLSERWGQPIVVENQGAAALTIGTGIAARATPDGYTLVMSDRSALTVAPHLYKSVPYDPVRDFAPVTLVATTPTLLVAHPSIPSNTLAEFVAYAKSQPHEVQFATAGPGTNNHILMELFRTATGLHVAPVHYKGGGASSQALLGGEVKVGFAALPNMLPHARAGRVKAFAITGRERFPGAPEVPTAAESGVQGLELDFWIGLLAPARTPPSLIARVNRDVAELLRNTALQAALLGQGARTAPGTPSEFAAFITAESAKMKRLVQATGMKAE